MNFRKSDVNESELLKFVFQYWNEWTKTSTLPVFMAISGPMGVGKSTLIRGLLTLIGVSGVRGSPTYLRESVYQLPHGRFSAVHSDWYRIKSEDELFSLGWEERLLDASTHCFVEWPEKAPVFISRILTHARSSWQIVLINLQNNDSDPLLRNVSIELVN